MGIFSRKVFKPGHANFETNFLEITPEAVRVRYTKKSLLFYGIFAAIGIILPVAVIFAESADGSSPLPVLIFGAIFMLAGLLGISTAVRRRYPMIDLQQRIFYPQGREKGSLPDMSSALPLSEIQEIVINKHRVTGKKNSYNCCELLLICKNGQQFTFLHHGAHEAFMRDARRLAEVLQLPLPPEEKMSPQRILAGGIVLLIFSLFWLVFTSFFFLMAYREQNDGIPGVIFAGIFILVGAGMFIKALVMIIMRRR